MEFAVDAADSSDSEAGTWQWQTSDDLQGVGGPEGNE